MVVRTVNELEVVVERDPFADVADDPKRYQVSFLSARRRPPWCARSRTPTWRRSRSWSAAARSTRGTPNGIQRSPLAKLLTDKKLGVTATARNWNTVLKLLELARG